jgi:hypothetical protein
MEQDSIYFVDEQQVQLPHPSTWEELNTNQLIDIKNQLINKILIAKKVPAYQVPLQKALAQIEGLISKSMDGSSREP